MTWLADLRRFYLEHFAPPPLVPPPPRVPPLTCDGEDEQARVERERMAASRRQRIEAEEALARLRALARSQGRVQLGKERS